MPVTVQGGTFPLWACSIARAHAGDVSAPPMRQSRPKPTPPASARSSPAASPHQPGFHDGRSAQHTVPPLARMVVENKGFPRYRQHGHPRMQTAHGVIF